MSSQSAIMTATTLAMNRPYPARNVVNTLAEARIFQGQMAKARNSTRYWAARDGQVLGEQQGDVAAKWDHVGGDVGAENAEHPAEGGQEDGGPRASTPVAVQDGAEQVPGIPQLEAPAVVDGGRGQDASEADSVTARGLVSTCDHMAPVRVLLQRAMSGWLVMSEAVLPMPALMADSTNQALPPAGRVVPPYTPPRFAPVLTMQKMNRPKMAGSMTATLKEKNQRIW